MRGVVKFLSDMTLRKTAGNVPIVENESQKINNAFTSNPSVFAIEHGRVFCEVPSLIPIWIYQDFLTRINGFRRFQSVKAEDFIHRHPIPLSNIPESLPRLDFMDAR